jgi:hypothetical protein
MLLLISAIEVFNKALRAKIILSELLSGPAG